MFFHRTDYGLRHLKPSPVARASFLFSTIMAYVPPTEQELCEPRQPICGRRSNLARAGFQKLCRGEPHFFVPAKLIIKSSSRILLAKIGYTKSSLAENCFALNSRRCWGSAFYDVRVFVLIHSVGRRSERDFCLPTLRVAVLCFIS